MSDDNTVAYILEVNSETDFVARDDNFMNFANDVLNVAFENSRTDVAELMEGDLEAKREALVQKIGENITVRRIVRVEGPVVGAYVHSTNKIASVVALTAGSAEVARDVAMHVAAVNPRVGKPEDMPADELEKEKAVIKAQPDMEGKPAEIVEKMMGGRIKKFLAENSLVEQPFVKNPDQSVGQLIKDNGGELVSFVRLEVGEGIEKEEVDFAAEVAAPASPDPSDRCQGDVRGTFQVCHVSRNFPVLVAGLYLRYPFLLRSMSDTSLRSLSCQAPSQTHRRGSSCRSRPIPSPDTNASCSNSVVKP